jgi:hypothetical protein
MTICTGHPAEQYLELYLQGALPEAEAQSFEEHYFDCPVCLAQVEALQAVWVKLAAESREPVKKPIPWPKRTGARWSVLGAIAAILLIGFLTLHFRQGKPEPSGAEVAGNHSTGSGVVPQAHGSNGAISQPVPQSGTSTPAAAAISSLADLSLPAFVGANLRGQSRNAHFDEGMKAYTSHACPRAIVALAMVPPEDEDARTAQVYRGVCLMSLGRLPEARTTLHAVADAGDSPQQEAALYYLAQTALLGEDAQKARHDLLLVIAIHGEFAVRASAQVSRLRALEAHR